MNKFLDIACLLQANTLAQPQLALAREHYSSEVEALYYEHSESKEAFMREAAEQLGLPDRVLTIYWKAFELRDTPIVEGPFIAIIDDTTILKGRMPSELHNYIQIKYPNFSTVKYYLEV